MNETDEEKGETEMDWGKVIDKGKQGFVTTGIGGAIGLAVAAILIGAIPELETHEASLALILTIIASALINSARNFWKHREKYFGLLLVALILPLLFVANGCASLKSESQPVDNLLTNIGEGEKFGTQVVIGPEGAPAVVGEDVVKEARPGFEIEFWNNGYNDETNAFWSDNLVTAAANAMAAAVGFVDPWAGVVMLATNGIVNNLTVPTVADVFIPEYFVGNRVRIRISGEAIAAGGTSQGDAVTDTTGEFVGSNLEHKPYTWWVIFDKDVDPNSLPNQ